MSKNVNLDVKQIPIYLNKLKSFLITHGIIIFLVTVITIYGFLVFQINRLSSVEPSEEQLAEQLSILKRPQIDQTSIDKILELRDQNIAVKSLFEEARDNPFKDN